MIADRKLSSLAASEHYKPPPSPHPFSIQLLKCSSARSRRKWLSFGPDLLQLNRRLNKSPNSRALSSHGFANFKWLTFISKENACQSKALVFRVPRWNYIRLYQHWFLETSPYNSRENYCILGTFYIFTCSSSSSLISLSAAITRVYTINEVGYL